MKTKRLSADTLIDLAVATLKDEIAPVLPAEKRYTLAMIVNALEIARREVLNESESAVWEVLDKTYDDGDGTAVQLAADIRSGNISDATHPDLSKMLRRMLVGEVRINNPKALPSKRKA